MAFDSPAPISRRTVAKGIAWTAPAVAIAGTAPAFAVSRPPIEVDFGNSTACKIPGKAYGDLCYANGYVLWGAFNNNTSLDATVTLTTITVGVVERCVVSLMDYDYKCETLRAKTFTIAAGDTRYIAIFTNTSSDASSTTVTAALSYTLTGQSPATTIQSGTVTGEPWQGSCNFPARAGSTCNDSKDTPPSACNTGCEAN